MISRIGKLLVETTGTTRLDAAQALRATDVVLVVGDNCDVLLARSALALTLRCFTGTTVVRAVNGGSISAPIAQTLHEEAAAYGAADRLSFGGRGDGLTFGLACATGDCFVDPRSWTVSVNELAADHHALVSPPAAAFAAAAGVAKLFGALMGRDVRVRKEAWTAPLLDFPPGGVEPNAEVDLGRVLLVGAGAIGSGLAHVLRGSPWRADLTLVDHQRYDEPNHETTLVVSKETTLRQAPKAAALAARLRSSALAVEAIPEKIVEGHRLLAEPFNALVCAVDNPELRRLLDGTAAGVVFNAGVGGSRDDAGMVLWTRHRRDEVPLSAHYRETEDLSSNVEKAPADVVTDACSRLSYARVSLAAPFMGLAAGALLAASLAQEALRLDAPTNYFKVDMLGLQRWSTRKMLRRMLSSSAAT